MGKDGILGKARWRCNALVGSSVNGMVVCLPLTAYLPQVGSTSSGWIWSFHSPHIPYPIPYSPPKETVL